jgi:hypothetical protein
VVWGVGFERSDTGIVCSSPAQGMDVCRLFLCVVLPCVGRGLGDGQISCSRSSAKCV